MCSQCSFCSFSKIDRGFAIIGTMDVLRQSQAKRAYEKSVQEMMDEKMCRPGYRWYGEPLNRCLPAAVPGDFENSQPVPADPPPVEQPTPPPEAAIAAEVSKRQQQKKG